MTITMLDQVIDCVRFVLGYIVSMLLLFNSLKNKSNYNTYLKLFNRSQVNVNVTNYTVNVILAIVSSGLGHKA